MPCLGGAPAAEGHPSPPNTHTTQHSCAAGAHVLAAGLPEIACSTCVYSASWVEDTRGTGGLAWDGGMEVTTTPHTAGSRRRADAW